MITKRTRLDKITASLKVERTTFEPSWRENADYIMTRRTRFFTTERNRGDRRNQKIINSTAPMAARILQAGMHGGITSPSRPWFLAKTPDPALNKQYRVRVWNSDVTDIMARMFLSTNLYNMLPILYGDMGVFGTGAMSMLEDPNKIARFNTFPIGNYWLGAGPDGTVDRFYREIPYTIWQLVKEFVVGKDHPGEMHWHHVTPQVKAAWDNNNYDMRLDVYMFIEPNDDYNDLKLNPKYKKYSITYWEAGAPDGKFLKESGFDEFPILAPRWDTLGEDTYGTGPGMIVIGDCKGIQSLERKKGKALDKGIDPPLTGPTSMRNQKASLISGDITYVDVREGQKGLSPIHEVRWAMREVGDEMRIHEMRINRGFYVDLFMMMMNSDRREITAREVEEKHGEKLMQLGPLVERLDNEVFDPLIARGFAMMDRLGLIPPKPPELDGVPLKMEYNSIMHQAQRLIGINNIERFAGFVGNISGARPETADKVNWDEMIDEYGDRTSIPPRILNDEMVVKQIRSQRAEMMRQQQQQAAIAQGADTAKLLSQTDTARPSALSQLLGTA